MILPISSVHRNSAATNGASVRLTPRHLHRPGHQPCNQIAGTAEEQLARAQSGRPSRQERRARLMAELIAGHPAVYTPVLLDLLVDPISIAIEVGVQVVMRRTV